jgi:subtilisin-like proprotein convertase family protein
MTVRAARPWSTRWRTLVPSCAQSVHGGACGPAMRLPLRTRFSRAALYGGGCLVVGVGLPWSGALALDGSAGSMHQSSQQTGPVHQRGAVSTTFSNPGAILIPDLRAAAPYPSTIEVSGLSAPTTDVNVELTGFSHTCPDDVEVLLVGPHGQQTLLMADIDPDACSRTVTPTNLTFDSSASSAVPSPPTTGTWLPTDGALRDDDTFPVPAPTGSTHPLGLSVFSGTAANGTWSLYVLDVVVGDSGSVAGGWRLQITTDDQTPPDTTITQARIMKAARKARFGFASNEAGSTFTCRLDIKPAKPCSSTVGYRHLKPGRHMFTVYATDATGNSDQTPATKRFKTSR